MNKKLLVSVFLCFFVLSLGVAEKKEEAKAKTIELLLRTDLLVGFNAVLWGLEPDNFEDLTEGTSDIYNLGYVLPSPKSDALYFGVWGFVSYKWAPHHLKRAWVGIKYSIISSDIPDGIEVYFWGNYPRWAHTDNALNESMSTEEYWFTDKVQLVRNEKNYWQVRDIDTGISVPPEKAVRIINKIIDNGFDIQFQVEAEAQGLYWISLSWIAFEVTRVS